MARRSARDWSVFRHAQSAPHVLGVQVGDASGFGLLRRVRMLGALVDAQVASICADQRALGQHALDGLLEHALGEAAVEDRPAVRSLMPPG